MQATTLILTCLPLWVLGQNYSSTVDSFTEFVLNSIHNSESYQLPVNASEYEPNSTSIKDYGTFDFIVIGTGSGGSVVANSLSEIKSWKILVLEAGSFGNDITDIPLMYYPLVYSKYNWGYNSTPQTTSCLGMIDHKCALPRGKGVGGTTLINGLVYSRGHKIDYDRWEALGNPGWSYKDVLPYFKKVEHFNPIPPVQAPVDLEYHGRDGYLNVEFHRPTLNPQLDAFLKANEEIGVPIDDYNANKIAASPAQINTIRGKREDDGKAFLRPILNNRSNLKLLTQSYVTKILTTKTTRSRIRATGVIFSSNGTLYRANATKDVIVSAGVYNTAQLLLLSGVGPAKHLKEKNVPQVADLEVGSYLKNHAAFYGLIFTTNASLPSVPYQQYVKDYFNGVGALTVPGGNQGVGFYESNFTKGTGYPDIELMMIPSNATNPLSKRAFLLTQQTFDDVWAKPNPLSSFVVYVIALHSRSTGTVRLNGNDPYDYPQIDTRFLSDPDNRDIDTLYQGIQLTLKLINTEAFKSINATITGGPLRACNQHKYLSKDYWYCALRQMSVDIYHPISTCPMGPKPEKGDIVDANLTVHGFSNLRVIDASVIPFPLSGHPNAAVTMVAEKGSDIIKRNYGVLQ